MLTCKQASQIISASLDKSLTLRERVALQFHLIICKYCNRFSTQLQSMRVAMKQMTNSIENDDTIVMPLEAKKLIAQQVEANSTQP